MSIRQKESPAAAMEQKKEVLHGVYTVYSLWVERFRLACQKGCAACCTQSVTMSSLEGEVIIDYVKQAGMEKWLLSKLTHTSPGKYRVRMTTNQYAAACLNHQDIVGDTEGDWDFTPCIFLDNTICSVYEVRPFGCRSFGSLVPCKEGMAAEMLPIHLTVNTVLTQIIEHLNSGGGHWATMSDILCSLQNCEIRDQKLHLLPALPVPGFLLEPHEAKVVNDFLKKLRRKFSAKGIIGDQIDNFMTI